MARYRARLAKTDPSYLEMTDAEVADSLRSLAQRMDPISLESEANVWAIADSWREATSQTLVDDVFDRWWRRRAIRDARSATD